MIDTIKFSIHRDQNISIYEVLLHKSKNKIGGFILNNRQSIVTRSEVFVFKAIEYESYETVLINGTLSNTHEYNIHYRCHLDRIDIEFSLPKFIYGTNVFELRSHFYKNFYTPYNMLILGIKEFFNFFFPNNVVNWGGIELLRWDFCYNQIFESPEIALQCLKYQKLKVASNCDRLTYEHGLVQLTKSNYLKIYYKGIEFEKHDRVKYTGSYLKQIQLLANNTLRYEKKITIKNIAYWYNSNFKFQHQPELKILYLKAKRKGKLSKSMRSDFENVQRFTFGNSQIYGATLLTSTVFNLLYDNFKLEIKRKFSVGKMCVDPLRRQVIQGTKNKTMKIRILSLIKVFKSLKRAYESGAISKSTYYRYTSFNDSSDFSQTNVSSNIYQDWDSKNYFSFINKSGINIFKLCNNQKF